MVSFLEAAVPMVASCRRDRSFGTIDRSLRPPVHFSRGKVARL
jgi:hypothetical protein